MFDDVIIGNGPQRNSAVRIDLIGKHGISANDIQYWIHTSFLDFGIKIYKNTLEGKTITKYIEDGESVDKINKYINGIVLERCTLKQVEDFIETKTQESFDKGVQYQQDLIRNTLNIPKNSRIF